MSYIKKMQSLALETETICKQFKGVLMRNTYAHPQLKEQERQLTESLRQNTKISSVAKQPCLVLYNSRPCYIVNKQFLLHRDAVTPGCDIICLAFFHTLRERLQFTEYYLLPRAYWDKVSVVQSFYKPLHLQHLGKVDLLERNDEEMVVEEERSFLTHSSTTITEEVEKESPFTEIRPFWLHQELEERDQCQLPPNNYLCQYMQVVIDTIICRRYYSDLHSLKKKGLAYYATRIQGHHAAMTLLFISQLVEHSGATVTNAIHAARKDCKEGEWFLDLATPRLYQEWLDMQVCLFKECRWHTAMAEDSDQLREHITFMRRSLPQTLWPAWLSYTVDDTQEYWLELVDTNYVVRVEWLLKPAFDSLLCRLLVEKGYAQLSPQLFQTVFLPLLYQCVMDDVRHYLFYVYYAGDASTNVTRDNLRRLRDAYTHSRDEMKALDAQIQKCVLYSPQSLFSLAAEAGDISSPVVRKMIKTRPEFDLSRTKDELDATTPWYERHIQRQEVPDIEDLGNKKVAPPCMQRVFGKEERPKMGYNDRMNVVRYLIDMAYTKEEVTHFLCRGYKQDKGEYELLIGSIYDSFVKEKRLNRDQRIHTQHHSFSCSSLINTVPTRTDNNFLRCQFAVDYEEENATPRRKYNDKEKDVFRFQCGATLKEPLKWGTKHPVQYSLLRIDL